MKVVPETCREH